MLSISRRIWIWILGFWTSRLDILLSFSLTLLYVLSKDKYQSEIFSESYSPDRHIPWKSWVQSTFVTTSLKKSLVSKHWGIPVLLCEAILFLSRGIDHLICRPEVLLFNLNGNTIASMLISCYKTLMTSVFQSINIMWVLSTLIIVLGAVHSQLSSWCVMSLIIC